MKTLHRDYDNRFEQVSNEMIQLRKTRKQHAV